MFAPDRSPGDPAINFPPQHQAKGHRPTMAPAGPWNKKGQDKAEAEWRAEGQCRQAAGEEEALIPGNESPVSELPPPLERTESYGSAGSMSCKGEYSPELAEVGASSSVSSNFSSDDDLPALLSRTSSWPLRPSNSSESEQEPQHSGDCGARSDQAEGVEPVLQTVRPASDFPSAQCGTPQPSQLQVATVAPSHWSERRLQLAERGPLHSPGVSVSEFLWWASARGRSLFLLSLMYSTQYYVIVALLLPVLLLERQYAALAYCAYAIAYSTVFFITPERDGRRSSASFQRWYGALMQELAVLHFNGIRIVRESEGAWDPHRKYIFGYHPHGLLPAIFAWIPNTGAWRKLFGTIQPIGLVATAIFKVPILRDLNLWGGLREVSRKSFRRALEEKKAVMICPGGQSELALHQHSSRKRILLSARKTGFIRLALEAGAQLVPMLVFGESQLLDNPFDFPAAQRFTYKLFGFPIPFMPLGLFGLLPVPRRGPVTLVVGQPLDAKLFCSSAEPTAAEVGKFRDLYYNEVEVLFMKYREQLGFSEWELVIEKII